jgi:uncharacterized protein
LRIFLGLTGYRCISRLTVWLIVVGWVLAGVGVGAAMAERRVALVIGNSDYRHTRVLANPKNDAEAIAKLLLEIGFAAGDVTLRTNLDYRAMREELRTFAGKAAGAEVAVVYFAGHGLEMSGENYLVPVDAKLERVLNVVSAATKLKLVILDACRTNPQADKIALPGGAKRDVTRGLARIEPVGDVLVAYAAKAGTVALDGTGQHSPYAEALLKHLPTPGVDVFRLFGRVAETVLTTTGKQQEPWLYGRPGGEVITLVPVSTEKATPPPVLPPPPPPPGSVSATDTMRVCREVESMTSLSVLGALLADQPNGTVARNCIAARMDELRKQEPEKKTTVAPPPKAPNPAPVPVTECDRLAAPPDAVPGVQGVYFETIDAVRAVPACRDAVALYPDEVRLQVWLGRALDKATSYAEARGWFEKAAALGERVAMSSLGSLYAQGHGVTQSYATARSWYEKAAALGNPSAMTGLGWLYLNGHGVSQDYGTARSWFEKAAALGERGAMTSLGLLYDQGYGVRQSDATARSWLEKGAKAGEGYAMRNLAIYDDAGRGAPRSPQRAARYLLAAARAGTTIARQDLDGDMAGWSHDARRAVQQLLTTSGDYSGPIDGQWGPASRAAAKAYYMRPS